MTPQKLIFPDGSHPISSLNLDIIVAEDEGMAYPILRSYLADFVSVLEMVDALSDPHEAYDGKVKKGAYCAGIL